MNESKQPDNKIQRDIGAEVLIYLSKTLMISRRIVSIANLIGKVVRAKAGEKLNGPIGRP
jgi:hypothetical protein